MDPNVLLYIPGKKIQVIDPESKFFLQEFEIFYYLSPETKILVLIGEETVEFNPDQITVLN
jgi:hypothetical protein